MMIGWSDLQTSEDPKQPSTYLLAAAVKKSTGSKYEWEHRQPVPEILHGNPTVVQSAIHALPFKCRYRVATLSFTQQDVDVFAFNGGDQDLRLRIAAAVEIFVEMALSGIPEGDRPPMLVGTHTHTGSLEVNIVIPRYALSSTGKVLSYNPHSPMRGSTLHWDALRDFLNNHFGWRNPKDGPEAPVIRGPDWAEKKLANVARLGHDINPKSDPKLYLLWKSKELLVTPQVSPGPTHFAQLKSLAAGLGYTTNCPKKGKLVFSNQALGHPLHIRIVAPHREDGDPSSTADHIPELSARWRRRAVWNAEKFSHGSRTGVEPDWASILQTPTLKIPACHPDQVTVEAAGRRSNLPLWTLLRHQLRTLARKLSRQVFETSIFGQISNLPIQPFRTLANSLETTTHDYDRTRAFPRTANDRTVQPAEADIGSDVLNGPRKPLLRADGRDNRDPQRDGTTQQRTCAPSAKRNNRRSNPTSTERDFVTHEEFETGYRLDLTDPRVAGISTGELIRVMLSAAEGKCRMINRQSSRVIELEIESGRMCILSSGKIFAHGDLQVVRDIVKAVALKVPVVCETDLNTGNDDLRTGLLGGM